MPYFCSLETLAAADHRVRSILRRNAPPDHPPWPTQNRCPDSDDDESLTAEPLHLSRKHRRREREWRGDDDGETNGDGAEGKGEAMGGGEVEEEKVDGNEGVGDNKGGQRQPKVEGDNADGAKTVGAGGEDALGDDDPDAAGGTDADIEEDFEESEDELEEDEDVGDPQVEVLARQKAWEEHTGAYLLQTFGTYADALGGDPHDIEVAEEAKEAQERARAERAAMESLGDTDSDHEEDVATVADDDGSVGAALTLEGAKLNEPTTPTIVRCHGYPIAINGNTRFGSSVAELRRVGEADDFAHATEFHVLRGGVVTPMPTSIWRYHFKIVDWGGGAKIVARPGAPCYVEGRLLHAHHHNRTRQLHDGDRVVVGSGPESLVFVYRDPRVPVYPPPPWVRTEPLLAPSAVRDDEVELDGKSAVDFRRDEELRSEMNEEDAGSEVCSLESGPGLSHPSLHPQFRLFNFTPCTSASSPIHSPSPSYVTAPPPNKKMIIIIINRRTLTTVSS